MKQNVVIKKLSYVKCESRTNLHAVQYKQSLTQAINDSGYRFWVPKV